MDSTLLMLCNTPVYDITNSVVLNRTLCPFLDAKNSKKAYEHWRSKRAFLKSNRLAEQIMIQTGGRDTIGAKRRMSLVDSYWVRYSYDKDTDFYSITPYLNDFSETVVFKKSSSTSTPELTLGGMQPKRWVRMQDRTTFMRKIEDFEQVNAEMMAVKLAKVCKIPVMSAFIQYYDKWISAEDYITPQYEVGFIYLENMTSVKYSMIGLDQLGLSPNGFSVRETMSAFIEAGVKDSKRLLNSVLTQILFDGVVGNRDRWHNSSNWALFMNNKTGKREVSPMYDFNWAELKSLNDINIRHIASLTNKTEYVTIAISIVKHIKQGCAKLGMPLWERNAAFLIERLQNPIAVTDIR